MKSLFRNRSCGDKISFPPPRRNPRNDFFRDSEKEKERERDETNKKER